MFLTQYLTLLYIYLPLLMHSFVMLLQNYKLFTSLPMHFLLDIVF